MEIKKSRKFSPIGVFDSGLGGLTVLKAIRRVIPGENLIYFGDTAHVPYGTKSKDAVIMFSLGIAKYLISRKIKLLVVACNTASALAIEEIRRAIKIPVVGVIVPGSKTAARVTVNGRVGVIGTEATIASGAYGAVLRKISGRIKVFGYACPLFVPLVEEGWWSGDIAQMAADKYLSEFRRKGADTLILGCTHYPLIKKIIKKYYNLM